MSYRNLNPQLMFEKMGFEHTPECAFTGKNSVDFAAWKESTYPRVLATLGDWPEKAPLNPELMVEWEHDGLIKQRWLIDVGKHISAMFVIAIRKDLSRDEKHPAIFCWHGHGNFGKEAVMGNDSSAELREEIDKYNYSYGHQMAKKGFVTFAIDWMGIGERNPCNKPNWRMKNGNRDWCDAFYLHATMLGMTSLGMNVAQGIAATDFACTFPFVDSNRLGIMGLSGGGTMTTWSALCDKRFKAVEIIGYSDLWAHLQFRDVQCCGMQVAPGLFKLVDIPDLQGLLAPTPLLVDITVYDTCFRIDSSMACYRKLEKIYYAAAASDHLELDLAAKEHSWAGNKSEKFFRRYL